MKNVILDTNTLMEGSDLSQFDIKYIPLVVLEELDKHKHSDSQIKAYKARKALHKLRELDNVVYRTDYSYSLPTWLDFKVPDNKILGYGQDICTFDKDAVLFTNDLNMIEKAKALKIPVVEAENEKEEEIYTGIREADLTEEEYVDLLEGLNGNEFNLYPNEYLIINNITNDDQYLLMWNGKFFEEVKTRPISNKYINKINPLDIYQKAFIHMLQNDSVKLKITDSPFGCGKSFLMIHWALQMIDKGKYSKLIFIKSDTPPKGRKEFPAIPGGVNEKCDPLMGVLCDTTGENNFTDILLRNNSLEVLPIQFARGRSLKDCIVIINEAQNFTPSEMELLLSRVGENTVALIDGSNRQTDNRNCDRRSGLTAVSENFKSKTIAAQVNMVNDYRSEISKLVGQMDWSD